MKLHFKVVNLLRLFLLAMPAGFSLSFAIAYFPSIADLSSDYVDILLAGSITELLIGNPSVSVYRTMLIMALILFVTLGLISIYASLPREVGLPDKVFLDIQLANVRKSPLQILGHIGSLVLFITYVNPIIFWFFYLSVFCGYTDEKMAFSYVAFFLLLSLCIGGYAWLTSLGNQKNGRLNVNQKL